MHKGMEKAVDPSGAVSRRLEVKLGQIPKSLPHAASSSR
jgi:hypothetical protein